MAPESTTATVKERPKVFRGPEVQAILAGRKTMFREVIKPQPTGDDLRVCEAAYHWLIGLNGSALGLTSGDHHYEPVTFCCPYKVGDRLWVRETWAPNGMMGAVWFKAGVPVYSGGRRTGEWAAYDHLMGEPIPDNLRWRSPLFMPRWASRITLEITDVRVERINEISLEDVIAEGFEEVKDGPHANQYWREETGARFVETWDKLNAKRGFPFASGCWVWVVGFQRVED